MAVSNGQEIPQKAPGQAITAEDWNTLVRELNALRGIRAVGGDAGSGAVVTRSGGSIVVRTPPTKKAWVIPARVIAAPTYAPTWPADAVYSAEAFGEPDLVLTDVVPTFHRLVASDGGPAGKGPSGIMPAKVGDRCYIHWLYTDTGELEAHLECPTETLHVVPCETALSGGAGGGEGGDDDDPGVVVVTPGGGGDGQSGAGEEPVGRP